MPSHEKILCLFAYPLPNWMPLPFLCSQFILLISSFCLAWFKKRQQNPAYDNAAKDPVESSGWVEDLRCSVSRSTGQKRTLPATAQENLVFVSCFPGSSSHFWPMPWYNCTLGDSAKTGRYGALLPIQPSFSAELCWFCVGIGPRFRMLDWIEQQGWPKLVIQMPIPVLFCFPARWLKNLFLCSLGPDQTAHARSNAVTFAKMETDPWWSLDITWLGSVFCAYKSVKYLLS